MSNLQEEKRRFIRFRLLAQGKVTSSTGEIYQGTLRDISIGGVFLDTPEFPEQSLNDDVAAFVEVSIDGEKHIIDAQAKVARVTNEGVGLFFSSMDETSKSSFSKIMKKIKERMHEK